MILKYYGHSFFTLTLENGSVIAFDPYGTFYEYPRRLLRADVCLISHHHFDHDGLTCLEPGAEVIDAPGAHELACGASVLGVPTFHDGQGGAQRGKNTFFIVEAEGLRVGHAGDLGHLPTRAQLRRSAGWTCCCCLWAAIIPSTRCRPWRCGSCFGPR